MTANGTNNIISLTVSGVGLSTGFWFGGNGWECYPCAANRYLVTFVIGMYDLSTLRSVIRLQVS